MITYTAVDQSGNKASCNFTIDVIVINCTSLTVDPGLPLRMSSCGNYFGAKCNFSCAIGYRLHGSSTVTCVAPGNRPPGSWDNPIPSCQAIKCPALPAPSHGIRQSCSGTTLEYYNTVCLFSCNFGFNGYGSSSRKCQDNGTWSGQDFLCIALSCGPVNIPPGATLLTLSCGNTYASSCVLGCQSGYVSSAGNVTTTCLKSGQWSGNPINCTDILPPTFGATCPSRSLVVYAERGLFSAEVNWTEPAATDNSGILPAVTSNHQPLQRLSQGTHVITYTAVDQSGNKATCNFTIDVIVITCTSLTVVPGLPLPVSNCGNHFGAKCNFSCTIGYRLNGSSSVTCVAPGNRPPGSWDSPLPSCEAVTCPAIAIPSNGLRKSCKGIEIERYDTVCQFSCYSGYTRIGSSSRRCLENGSWSGQEFSCIDVLPPTFDNTCPVTPLLVYAERGEFSAQVNWNEPVATDNIGATPSLSSNYKPPQRFSQGTHIIVYTAVDQSGNKATCNFTIDVIVINCTSPTVDFGGALRMSCSGNHFGAQCNFSCAIGHRLNGSSTVTCVAPGNRPPGVWDNPLPSCQAIRCPSLSVPTNGAKSDCSGIASELYDTHCSFSCNVGYNMIGSSVRRCLENGTWSGETTYCRGN